MGIDNPRVHIRKLSDFRPLEANPNRHTQRGLRTLEDSVQEDGWVAPVTVAADGESLDGAARLEVAADKFPDEALVVEHDGSRPVVMVRTDVADAKSTMARRIIYRANRVAEIDLDWDADQLLADLETGLDLSGLFTTDELEGFLAGHIEDIPENTPFANFNPDDLDAYVSFRFGDYGGRVSRVVYDSFVEEYQRQQEISGELVLDDILRAWLNV